MTEYQSNARKDRDKDETQKDKTSKEVQKVVSGEVVIQKKSLGRKFKDLIVEADFGGMARYVFADVLVPAAKSMFVDSVRQGAERIAYGESRVRRGSQGTRYDYSSPINRGSREPRESRFRTVDRSRSIRRGREDVILESREDAEVVLERMNDIIDNYEVVTVADLNELLGEGSTHADVKWGWDYLQNVRVRQFQDGYLLDLPPPQPIQ